MQDWKAFVEKLVELGVTNTSAEIASVINRNSGLDIRPSQVAGLKSSITKRKNKI